MNRLQKYINSVYRALFCASLAMILTGCAGEDPEAPSVVATPSETATADILISLGTDWNVDSGEDEATRAIPPGINNNHDDNRPIDGSEELKQVDRVRIITFRRRDPEYNSAEDSEDDNGNKTRISSEPFLYDRTNDLILEADYAENMPESDRFPAGSGHGKHKVTSGKITKVNGFEYRVVAIAYSSASESQFKGSSLKLDGQPLPEGDSGRFTLNIHDGLTFDEFEAQITTNNINTDNWREFFSAMTESHAGIVGNTNTAVMETPQFFYGECYTETADGLSKVIKYSDTDVSGNLTKDIPVTGILYRGVAKIEVNIRNVEAYKPTLTSYPCQWLALLIENIPVRVGLQNYDCFLPKNIDQGNVAAKDQFVPISFRTSAEKVTLTAYVLPCRARLAVRIRHSNTLGTVSYLHNGWLNAGDVETKENGTGIISPDSHDGYFYFRRNHKYVINVASSDALIRKYPL